MSDDKYLTEYERHLVEERDRLCAEVFQLEVRLREMTANRDNLIFSNEKLSLEFQTSERIVARLRDEVETWERIAQEGHPSPCTLGPLCPYCEIDGLSEANKRLRAERRKLAQFVRRLWATDPWEVGPEFEEIGEDLGICELRVLDQDSLEADEEPLYCLAEWVKEATDE